MTYIMCIHIVQCNSYIALISWRYYVILYAVISAVTVTTILGATIKVIGQKHAAFSFCLDQALLKESMDEAT